MDAAQDLKNTKAKIVRYHTEPTETLPTAISVLVCFYQSSGKQHLEVVFSTV